MPLLKPDVEKLLRKGVVIPAHPLALTPARRLDERIQRGLTRYYLAAGAGGIAVGVHTTQFAIRDKGLLTPVLQLAAETVREHAAPTVKVAGLCGDTKQAVAEARLAADLGYDLGLLNLAALADGSDADRIAHCREVGQVIPLFGFYLQPAVGGGRPQGFDFWRRFVEIPAVCAIKLAPFDRYRTLDVMRAVAASGRAGDLALYTGNDDNIVIDLLTDYQFGDRRVSMVGGLLGHWSVWTRKAVELLNEVKRARAAGQSLSRQWLLRANRITDANAALFDAANNFSGCIPGLHEILRRQGLMQGRWCLDPGEDLSPGQTEEIDRICEAYPDLQDDVFVAENRDAWLA